jgi:hypothetical protein
MDDIDSMPPTEAGTGGGNEEVGKSMRQRGCSDRSGGALFGAKKVRGSASPVGGRAAPFLAGTKQADEQGLRALGCHERDVRSRGDELLDGQAFGSLMTLFIQSLNAFSGVGASPVALSCARRRPARTRPMVDRGAPPPDHLALRTLDSDP